MIKRVLKDDGETTYNPDVVRFDNCLRTTRGDCGAMEGAITSFLRPNIGDPTMALFWRVSC